MHVRDVGQGAPEERLLPGLGLALADRLSGNTRRKLLCQLVVVAGGCEEEV